MKLIPETGRAH